MLETKEVFHELNNSFTICKGYLKMINKNIYQEKVLNEIENCIALINNHGFKKKIFLLNKMILETIDTYSNINVNYNSKDITFYGNKFKIKDMFINIINNSIEANATNINITSIVKNNKLIINIKDNGIGIKKDVLKKLKIENFTTKTNGHGIGLNCVKQTIKNHNGYLEINSIYHYGTTLIITFPI